jgi:hypothetical protein
MEIDFVKVNKCIKFSKVKKNNTYVADLGLAQHYLSSLCSNHYCKPQKNIQTFLAN